MNARLLASPSLRGWSRYTLNLLQALPTAGVDPILLSDAPLHPVHLARLPGLQVRVAPRMRYPLWEQAWLPWRCRQDRVDVLHAPFNFGLPLAAPCARVLTLHDAIPQVMAPSSGLRERLRRGAMVSSVLHWVARRAADQVITVSRHARGDLVERLGIPADRVTVVHEGPDARFLTAPTEQDRERARRRYGLTRDYVLYVGGQEERKNLPLLLRAFARVKDLAVDLVLAGGGGHAAGSLESLAASLGISRQTRLLGFVPDEDLPGLYAAAAVFVNPSRYEGFGLQLIEAMSIGCPTLAARATSLPEVLGDGGQTFSCDDPTELAALLRTVLTDPAVRQQLRARARARASDFSWERAARETVAVYGAALGRVAA